jgi:hypothetical protein
MAAAIFLHGLLMVALFSTRPSLAATWSYSKSLSMAL